MWIYTQLRATDALNIRFVELKAGHKSRLHHLFLKKLLRGEFRPSPQGPRYSLHGEYERLSSYDECELHRIFPHQGRLYLINDDDCDDYEYQLSVHDMLKMAGLIMDLSWIGISIFNANESDDTLKLSLNKLIAALQHIRGTDFIQGLSLQPSETTPHKTTCHACLLNIPVEMAFLQKQLEEEAGLCLGCVRLDRYKARTLDGLEKPPVVERCSSSNCVR